MNNEKSDIFCLRIGRIQTLTSDPESISNEGEFFDAICRCDLQTLSEFRNDPSKTSSFVNFDFVRRCAKAVTSTGSIDVLKVVVNTFCGETVKPSEVGEIFALETIASGRSSMVTGVLHHWVVTRNPYVSKMSRKILKLAITSNVFRTELLYLYCIVHGTLLNF